MFPALVAICAKLEHPAGWHRSTRYAVTPVSSVEDVHARLIWLLDMAVAVRPEGLVGGWVSGASVAALTAFE